MTGPNNGDKWKHKYFSALEELEQKEGDWEQADRSMRRGLSRLALAATGVDEVLDVQLNKLRRGIQDSASSAQLDLVIEKISKRLKTLDEQMKEDGAGERLSPPQLLLKLCEEIPFPKPLRKQVKALKRALKNSPADAALDQPLQTFVDLIAQAFQLLDADEKSGGSWWSKVFAGGEARPDVLARPAVGDDAEPEPGSTASLPGEEDQAPQILAQVFCTFLERLSFPPQFDERIAALKKQLAPGLPLDAVADMARTVVRLVMEVRLSLEQEKEELEDFLQQLGQRLQELESLVEGAENVRQASVQSGRELDDMVVSQMNDIEQTVELANDLTQVKGAIQGSLKHIRQHLAVRRGEEEERQAAMERQLRQLTQRVSEMEVEGERLRERLAEERASAMTDPLTEIPNRLAYDKQVVKEYSRWKRYQTPLCLLLCDIDFFKKINDTFGHKAGDRALVAIAQTIQYNIRDTDFLARVGGEEFVVLLSETDLEGAQAVAEKIRRGVELLEFVYGGQPVPITISGGVAEFQPEDTIDDVYVRADKGLYKAKKQGRNRFCLA